MKKRFTKGTLALTLLLLAGAGCAPPPKPQDATGDQAAAQNTEVKKEEKRKPRKGFSIFGKKEEVTDPISTAPRNTQINVSVPLPDEKGGANEILENLE